MQKNKLTQQEQLLQHFRKTPTITPLEALGLYNIFRLAAVVHELRNQNHKITMKIKTAPNGNPYGQYKYHGVIQELPRRTA